MRKEYHDLNELDDAVLELAALGLLEIAGKSYQAEFEAYCAMEEVRPPSPEKVVRLERAIKLRKRRDSMHRVHRAVMPAVSRAAVVFLMFFLGFSTVLVTSAEAREQFYQLVFTIHEEYSEVVIVDGGDSSAPANMDYDVTFMPPDFELVQEVVTGSVKTISYMDKQSNFIIISFTSVSENKSVRFDTENADYIQTVNVGNSMGLMVVKQGDTQLVWQTPTTSFTIISNLPGETLIRVAEGIKTN